MIVSVAEARYVDSYRVWLRFNTGEAGIVDLGELVAASPAALPVRDTASFARFHLDGWPTLAWDCGFDVAPEVLYQMLTGKPPLWWSTASAVASDKGCSNL